MRDFFTKSIPSALPYWAKATGLLVLISVFAFFRFLGAQERKSTTTAISGILRNDYLNANSYALSKGMADLELLKIMSCAVLTEKSELSRIYYDTTGGNSCAKNPLLLEYLEHKAFFVATNGLTYELRFQIPLKWSLIFVELLSYTLILISFYIFERSWNFQKSNHDLKIKALFLEKELFIDQTIQVRHDAASPITALRTIVGVLNNIDPEIKDFLKRTVARTEEVINQLNNSASRVDSFEVEATNLNSCIADIIKEKTVLWESDRELSCQINSFDSAFVLSNSRELKRIFSNLLNNAYESLSSSQNKMISITVLAEQETMKIKIADTGSGMPTEILEKIGTKGLSYGKEHLSGSGSGVGVYHALAQVAKWGGLLTYQSEIGRGTVATLILRKI